MKTNSFRTDSAIVISFTHRVRLPIMSPSSNHWVKHRVGVSSHDFTAQHIVWEYFRIVISKITENARKILIFKYPGAWDEALHHATKFVVIHLCFGLYKMEFSNVYRKKGGRAELTHENEELWKWENIQKIYTFHSYEKNLISRSRTFYFFFRGRNRE